MSDLDTLISRYLDGELSKEQATTLNAWIEESPAHAETFARVCMQHHLLREQIVGADLADTLAQPGDALEDSGVIQILSALETNARDIAPVDLTEELKQRRLKKLRASDTRRRWSMAASGNETVKVWVIPRAMVYVAAAAMILLALVLWPDSPPTPTTTAVTPDVSVIDEQRTVVAVLIDQIDAKWEGATNPMRVGGAVYNQPLVLTTGVARLRFNNQAEVVIEAPATFRPLSDSSLQLVSGKLVGHCRTERSRGFRVQTAGSEVTDLGTEFAVSTLNKQTDVHVFTGQVALRVLPTEERAAGQPLLFGAGDARRVDESAGKIWLIPAEPTAFLRGVPTRFEQLAKALEPAAYWSFDHDLPGTIQSLTATYLGAGTFVGGGTLAHDPDAAASDNKILALTNNAYVTIPATPLPATDQVAYTVAGWFRVDTVQEQNILVKTTRIEGPQKLFSHQLSVNDQGGFRHYVYASATGATNTKGDGAFIDSTTPIKPHTWYFVTISAADDGFARLYINGVEDAPAQRLPYRRIQRSLDTWHLGGSARQADIGNVMDAFDGAMDDVLVFDRELSPAQVQSLYHAAQAAHVSTPE